MTLPHFNIISIFPEMFQALESSIPGRAREQGLVSWQCWNPREFTTDLHGRVDDRPFGGGPGMVMQYQPLQSTIAAARQAHTAPAHVIYLSPQGNPLDQAKVSALSTQPHLILLCGRYEGIDQRLIDTEVDEEISIGDYVLSGGELAAMVLMDAIIRLLPGALGDQQSALQDSFSQGLLDCPHYTRPQTVAEHDVPEVLCQGDHQAIATWRMQQALGQTWLHRPDLLQKIQLNPLQRDLLNQFICLYYNRLHQ